VHFVVVPMTVEKATHGRLHHDQVLRDNAEEKSYGGQY
jgi:hypothetical protein